MHLTEYLHDFDYTPVKIKLIKNFLTAYTLKNPCDIYRWLWEGEYGNKNDNYTLDGLLADIHASMKFHRPDLPVCENAGLALTMLKINLSAYSKGGFPLKRLLMMEERTSNIRPNPIRFKEDWILLKSNLTKEYPLQEDDLTYYEETIPFHNVPEVSFSEDYINKYGTFYRIVPGKLFFEYFPEFELENEQMFG